MKSSRVRRHRLHMALVGVATLAALTACGADPADGTEGAAPAIVIGAPKDGNVSAQLALADSLGYFQDASLDVSIRYFPNAGELSTAVAAGSISVGAGGTTPVTTLRASGFPAVVLAQLSDISGAQQVVTSPAITGPEDLVGRKMGVALGTISELLAESFLEEYGLSRDDVTFVNLSATDMITALERGDVDAAALWEPNATRAVAGGAQVLVTGTTSFVGGSAEPQRLVGDHAVLFAEEGWVGENPDTVDALIEALVEATTYIETEPDDARARVGEALGLTPEEAENTFAVNEYVMRIDEELIADMEAEAAFLLDKGKVDEMVSAADWVRPDRLEAVSPDLVSWRP